MSVQSKMTAIASKIRALLGITETMGLDAMATNLEAVQTDLTTAFATVSNKGGTIPSLLVSGNLEAAINSIPTGASNNSPYSYAEEFIWTAPSGGETIYIPHSLGVEPDGFNIVAMETEFGDAGYIINNIVFDRAMLYANTYPFIAYFGIGSGLSDNNVHFYLIVDNEAITSTHINIAYPDEQIISAGKQYRVLVYKR